MDLKGLNPLDYFRELGPFSRVLLLVAFILIFMGGIAKGLTPHNPILVTATALILLSFAIYYLSEAHALHPNPPDPQRPFFWNWERLFTGIVFLMLTILSCL